MKKYILVILSCILFLCGCQSNLPNVEEQNAYPKSIPPILEGKKETPSPTEGRGQSLKNPKAITMKYTDPLIKCLVDSEWSFESATDLLGEPDSYFNRYSIWFEEGVSISRKELEPEDNNSKWYSTISGDANNVLFDSKYRQNIIEDITMQSKKDDVIAALGEPCFIDDSLAIFGYITEDLYLFFVGADELQNISIYRRETEFDKSVIRSLVEIAERGTYSEQTAQEMTAVLDREWPTGYNSKYDGGNKFVAFEGRYGKIGRTYYARGITLTFDYHSDGMPILNIYANSNINTEEIQDSPLIKIHKKDLMFVQEQHRLLQNKKLEEDIKEKGVLSPDKMWCILQNYDGINYWLPGLFVISTKGDRPNVEFYTNPPISPDEYQWIDNRYFVYTEMYNGVFVYDRENKKAVEVSYYENSYGKEVQPRLVSVDKGQIVYNDYFPNEDKSDYVNKNVYVRYSFDKNGDIVFD